MNARLIEIDWPEFGTTDTPPDWRESLAEYRRRLDRVRGAMRGNGWTHLVVYGDREHFANLAWLIGFDPRFEEALLLISDDRDPLLLAGIECMNYLPAAPPVAAGLIRTELYPSFSLPSMPREGARALADILGGEGIDAHSRVGVAGWKSYGGPHSIDVPSYLTDAIRFAAGYENVVNAADLFVNPDDGLRATATAAEIAFFEWTNTLASEGLKRVIRAVRPGALDYELLENAHYNGVPLCCHMTLKCGNNRVSLASARGERVIAGGRFSSGIAYWGANCCRCGWVVEDERGLPAEAHGYMEHFAGPYFSAMGAWFDRLHIGATGAELHEAIHSRLPFGTFHIGLNAGHLIHLDEWVSSPVNPNSQSRLRSGMVFQADVIPSHPQFYSSRMEDGYAIADSALQSELTNRFPALMTRCLARRDFLRNTLRLPIHEDVLPLGNLCGIVPPYLLRPNHVLAL